MRKHVYRVGDIIRVNNPRVVKRVGYPKTLEDYMPSDTDENLLIATRLIQGESLETASDKNLLKSFRVSWDVLRLAAYQKAKKDGFGGKERRIHFEQLDFWPNSSLFESNIENFKPFNTEVIGKRNVRIGDYYPAHFSSHDSDDYDPAGLSNAKSVVLIKTSWGEFVEEDISPIT